VGGIGGIAGRGGTFGGGGTGGNDCNALRNEVLTKLAQAQICCPYCDALQCTAIVEGMCCPVLVNSNGQQTQSYLAALKKLLQTPGCAPICPDVLCREPQIGNCVANAVGGGSCR